MIVSGSTLEPYLPTNFEGASMNEVVEKANSKLKKDFLPEITFCTA